AGSTLDEALRRAAADATLSAAATAVRQWKYEAPATPIVFVVLVNFSSVRQPTVSEQDVQTVQAARGRLPSPPPPPTIPPPWPAAEAAGAVRAGNGIRPPQRTKSATPIYSREAREARVQGTVRVEILVGTDGKVKDARVLQSASPLLDQPAIDSARRWEFTPTIVNGEPRPIVLMMEVDFNLR